MEFPDNDRSPEATPLPISAPEALAVIGKARRVAVDAANLSMTAAGQSRWGAAQHALYLHVVNAILGPITRQMPRLEEDGPRAL